MSANKSKIGNAKYKQGKYRLINENKYQGDPNSIIFRSSWEYIFCSYLDNNQSVIKWKCEDPVITYTDLRGKIHRYYPDFYYEQKTDNGDLRRVIVEIKPKKELYPPEKPKKQTAKSLENYEYAVRTHIKNKLKWSTALEYAKKRKMEFIIITEDQLKRAGLLS